MAQFISLKAPAIGVLKGVGQGRKETPVQSELVTLVTWIVKVLRIAVMGGKFFYVTVPLEDIVWDLWRPALFELEYWCARSKQYLLIYLYQTCTQKCFKIAYWCQ